jgi:hypothetical protein
MNIQNENPNMAVAESVDVNDISPSDAQKMAALEARVRELEAENRQQQQQQHRQQQQMQLQLQRQRREQEQEQRPQQRQQQVPAPAAAGASIQEQHVLGIGVHGILLQLKVLYSNMVDILTMAIPTVAWSLFVCCFCFFSIVCSRWGISKRWRGGS